jgi:hypothetical protein
LGICSAVKGVNCEEHASDQPDDEPIDLDRLAELRREAAQYVSGLSEEELDRLLGGDWNSPRSGECPGEPGEDL